MAPENDRKAHELIGIPANEVIVQLIACGMPPDEFDVASSPRRPLEDILTWHTEQVDLLNNKNIL